MKEGEGREEELELELKLIQTHMTQKPMLRVEVGARALRVLIKKIPVSATLASLL